MFLISVWICIQMILCLYLLLPFLTYVIALCRSEDTSCRDICSEKDFAIIVTAYEQVNLLPSVVKSILSLEYSKFQVYVVADNCDVSSLKFNSERVSLLQPVEVLGSNTKSHFYAINRFVRPHELLTIIDSDNLVDPGYLRELNRYFSSGFLAVQGQRKAKNLNTSLACLDEAGDMFYRFIDRKLLFSAGSSASLAGSGMAFSTTLYRECLESLEIEGAGFDKALQTELLIRGNRIAFAEGAIVYDEKTSKSDQLVKQRSRWINTWFKYSGRGIQLTLKGLLSWNANQLLNGLVFSRPPLFILLFLIVSSAVLDALFMPKMLYVLSLAVISFFFIFFKALKYFKATRGVYISLLKIPIFIFYQLLSLLNSRRANKLSTATVHYYDSETKS